MTDNDTLKYIAAGLAVAGLGLVMFTSWTGFGQIAIVLAVLLAAYLIYREGLSAPATSKRQPAIALQLAVIVLAFAVPYTWLVKPAIKSAELQRRNARLAKNDLESYESTLRQMEAEKGVQVSELGLQREERRNLAVQLDVERLQDRLVFVSAGEGGDATGEDELVLLQQRIEEAREHLRQRKARAGAYTDFSKVERLGVPEEQLDAAKAPQALAELEVVVSVLERCVDAGVRKVESIDLATLEPGAHDQSDKIDVAVRTVTVEVLADLESHSRLMHLLQTERPYLGLTTARMPAALVKEGRRGKQEEKQVITGDYVTAKYEVQAFYVNDGLLQSAGEAAGGAGESGSQPPRKRWF